MFTIKGHSRYLESILLPDTGASDIPDNITRRHALLSETTTEDLVVPDNGGNPLYRELICIFYMNSSDTYFGSIYYIDSNTGAVTFLKNINVSQELKDSWDYARLVSRSLYVNSSTIASGTFELSGTINAINFTGTPTELLFTGTSFSSSYNKILAAVKNPCDKIGNVPVLDGIALLALPDTLGEPYQRLEDPSPVTTTELGTYTTSIVNQDRNQNTNFEMVNSTSITVPFSGSLTNFTMNVDSTSEVMVFIRVFMLSDSPNPAANGTVQLRCDVTALDLGGTAIISDTAFNYYYDSSYNSLYNGTGNPLVAEGFVIFKKGSIVRPVAQISANVTLDYPAAAAAEANFDLSCYGTIMVPQGGRPGSNSPISVAWLKGLTTGQTINITGVSNYELIPNAVLSRNLDTKYALYDPYEINYVKQILHARDSLDIRSVYQRSTYLKKRDMFLEFSMLHKHEVAQAASFSSIIKGIKKYALPIYHHVAPVLKQVVPVQYRPIFEVADQLIPKGRSRLNAASKRSYDEMENEPVNIESFSSDEELPIINILKDINLRSRTDLDDDTFSIQSSEDYFNTFELGVEGFESEGNDNEEDVEVYSDYSSWHGTIIENDEDSWKSLEFIKNTRVAPNGHLVCTISINDLDYIPQFFPAIVDNKVILCATIILRNKLPFPWPHTVTPSGYFIYGTVEETTALWQHNILLCAVQQATPDTITIDISGLIDFAGKSYELAAFMTTELSTQHYVPLLSKVMYSGRVSNGKILQIAYQEEKKLFAAQIGFKIIGNSNLFDVDVSTLNQLLYLGGFQASKTPLNSHYHANNDLGKSMITVKSASFPEDLTGVYEEEEEPFYDIEEEEEEEEEIPLVRRVKPIPPPKPALHPTRNKPLPPIPNLPQVNKPPRPRPIPPPKPSRRKSLEESVTDFVDRFSNSTDPGEKFLASIGFYMLQSKNDIKTIANKIKNTPESLVSFFDNFGMIDQPQRQIRNLKFQSLTESLRKSGYPSITYDWVVANGGGPSQAQAAYHSRYGKLPEPGSSPAVEGSKGSSSKIDRYFETVMEQHPELDEDVTYDLIQSLYNEFGSLPRNEEEANYWSESLGIVNKKKKAKEARKRVIKKFF